MRKLFKRFLQSFITIETTPLTKDGLSKEYCEMYIFNRKVISGIL